MSLLEALQKRRSVRTYTGEKIPEGQLAAVLQAGLLSPTGHNARSWEFIVVTDKEMLKQMAKCRTGSANMLEGADAAVVVLGNEELTDVWVEDCSIAMSNMHLMADSLGLGSCWIQGRLRDAENGQTAEEYLRGLLGYPKNCHLEAVLSLGMPLKHPEKRELSELLVDRIHREKF